MFSGLIEAVGRVSRATQTAAGLGLRIRCRLAAELAAGDSVAVNGVCLTAVAADADGFTADVSPETARVTTLGAVCEGTRVNLERPLRADGRVGGHFVLGHVDATGQVAGIREEAEFRRVSFEYPPALKPLIVPKGSIAVDGISLTVAALDGRRFDVQIVPYTWDNTRLRSARVGDAVNLECDIIGKYVLNAVDATQGKAADEPAWFIRGGTVEG